MIKKNKVYIVAKVNTGLDKGKLLFVDETEFAKGNYTEVERYTSEELSKRILKV